MESKSESNIAAELELQNELLLNFVSQLSKGENIEKIKGDYSGKTKEIIDEINSCTDIVYGILHETERLTESSTAGELDVRGDADRFPGGWGSIITGMNNTLDAVIQPLNVAAEYVERISRGDIPEKITYNYNGDFNEIKNNLNLCIEGLGGLVEANKILQNIKLNDFTEKTKGSYAGIFKEVCDALNDVIDHNIYVQETVSQIAEGNLERLPAYKAIGKRCENDKLLPAYIAMMSNIQLLTDETQDLTDAAIMGKLDVRADSSKLKGEYKKLVEGVNNTLDAVVEPFVLAAEYIERISRGDIPEKITAQYKGDYNEINNNLNLCIDALDGCIKDVGMMNEAAVKGDLDRRIDVSRHKGDFAKIGGGLNDTFGEMARVLKICGDFIESVSYGRQLEKITADTSGYYLVIRDNINHSVDVTGNVISEINRLTDGAIAGQLEIRGNTSEFDGAWAGIIGGINDTIEAFAVPANEGIRVLDEYSNNNYTARFNERIRVAGRFENFRNSIDNVGIQFSTVVKDTNKVVLEVNANSNEVSKGTNEIMRASEGVATTSQETARQTKELLENIVEINRQIADLSASNEEIASTSQEILGSADNMVKIGMDAQKSGDESKVKMARVEEIGKKSVDEINALTEQIKEVSNVVKLINDITGQINLLALNAAIEAARAGEHGRGFAVVAGEVKNLAAEARAATDNIEKVVSTVQTGAGNTSKAINTANVEILDSVTSVNETLEGLYTIINSAKQVSSDIGEVTKAIEDQANIANNVVSAADKGTQMTKNVQVQAEELAALAEESSASIEEIGSAIHEVTDLTDRLKTDMEIFRV
ncbi:methyl-accepting chemotaxis protein [Methanoplanus limicola]|nr:methyl-accepting chemotaxis protein [Methanoplanus limicola]